MNWFFEPWAWYIGGPAIAIVLLITKLLGKRLGVSSSFRGLCTIAGAGKIVDFFNFEWKKDVQWMLIMVVGIALGGYIATNFLSHSDAVPLSEAAVTSFTQMGINTPGAAYLPEEFFSFNALFTLKGFLLIVIGGFLVGFGSRYAGGCTSGHAMSGLSELQLSSLVAVIGFFIGGLLVTHIVLPLIFN